MHKSSKKHIAVQSGVLFLAKNIFLKIAFVFYLTYTYYIKGILPNNGKE